MASDDIFVRTLAENDVGLLRRLRLAALADAPTMFLQTFDEAAAYSHDDWHTRARRYAEGISGICFIAERGGQSIGMVFGFVDVERSFVARVGGMWVAQRRAVQVLGQSFSGPSASGPPSVVVRSSACMCFMPVATRTPSIALRAFRYSRLSQTKTASLSMESGYMSPNPRLQRAVLRAAAEAPGR